jgi:peptide/histidine transporter 3/4
VCVCVCVREREREREMSTISQLSCFPFFPSYVRTTFTSLENIGFVANMVSMVLYFGQVMLFYLSTSANTLTNFMGSTFLLSLVGAFISDTYLSRLSTCLLFGTIEILVIS